jgi:hypothetical protein
MGVEKHPRRLNLWREYEAFSNACCLNSAAPHCKSYDGREIIHDPELLGERDEQSEPEWPPDRARPGSWIVLLVLLARAYLGLLGGGVFVTVSCSVLAGVFF